MAVLTHTDTTTDTTLKMTANTVLPWLISASMVTLLVILLHYLKQTPKQPEQVLSVRKIDVALPAPPPPPPPQLKTSATSSEVAQTSLNIAGLGAGPKVNYADKPRMTLAKVKSLDVPTFTIDANIIKQRLALDMPLMAVEKLDSVPKVIKQKFFPIPKSVRKKGITRVSTEVELIIDQSGKPFVKRITDSVYPEMEEVIRNWVNQARFSIPKKDGRPVQAIYLYGIHFNHGR